MTAPARPAASPASEAWRVLAGDPVFWIAVALIGIAVLPYALPVLSADQLRYWGAWYVDVPVSIASLLAAAIGVRHVRGVAEQQFWTLVAFAYGALLLVESAAALVPDAAWTPTGGLVAEALYLLYFFLLLLATGASRGHGASRGAWNLDRLRGTALAAMAFGLILYFEGVPSAAAPDARPSWYPGLFLFAVLDVGLCFAFISARRVHEDRRWRSILVGMAGVSALFAVVDAAEATLTLEGLGDVVLSPYWDLAWILPQALFVVVARRHLADPQRSATRLLRSDLPRTDGGLLVLGLLSLPVLHVLLYAGGFLDPLLLSLRGEAVFLFLLVMGALTVAYLRTLEAEHDRGSRRLKLSEERYRSFVHAHSDGIYRAEPRSPIGLENPTDVQVRVVGEGLRIAEASDGSSPSDPARLIGLPLLDLVGPDESAGAEVLRRWIDRGYEPTDFEVTREGPLGTRHLSGSLTGVVEGRRLARAWVTLSDVTDQRLAARETERLERELEHAQRMETVGTLAGGIAHDFNNLLVPIMGFAELAKITTPPDHEATRESLDRVLQASHRAADLVEQVLAITRSEPRHEEVFEAQSVVREVMKLVRPGLPTTVEVTTSLDDACPPILGDPSRIHQVLINLCANAAQAIGKGRGHVQLRVSHDTAGEPGAAPLGWVLIEVSDDGPGIEPDLLGRVFEPFFTTKPPGEGTGLGLSVVHGIVTSHGGRVSIDSELALGTTVSIRLPATGLSSAPEVADEPAVLAETLSVLVVDDDEAVAGATREMLEAAGHRATSATDALQALEAVGKRSRAFDVLLTDQTMPGLTGLELARAAREAAPHLGVVIMSGYRLRFEESDRDVVHLDKPFTSAQLADALRAAGSSRRVAGPETA